MKMLISSQPAHPAYEISLLLFGEIRVSSWVTYPLGHNQQLPFFITAMKQVKLYYKQKEILEIINQRI